jgi:pyrroline-5-carboxylate reductase
MAEAGCKAGLDREIAMQLARETVSGAGELMRQSEDAANVLRENVTSPGGTTAAALSVLMADEGMQKLFDAAIAAAKLRSEEFAKQ